MKLKYLSLLVGTAMLLHLPAYATVSVQDDDDTLTLSNDKIVMTIDKDSASVTDIHQRGDINLVKTLSALNSDPDDLETFYLDYHTGVSGGGKSFVSDGYTIVSQDDHQVHLKFTGDADQYLGLEYHFILRDGVDGVYSYVVAYNNKDTTQEVAELRTVYRYDARVMPSVYNGTIWATPPLYGDLADLTKVQDETWQLSNGEVYTKYDLANYTRQAKFWGVFGSGHGAWFIPATHDYYPGDPQMQELIVHQDGIALNYMTGAHLGSPDMMAPSGWEKLYGPWLIYFNKGNRQQMIADAARQTAVEQAQWPYQWMTDSRYVRERGSLSGQVNARVPVEVVLTSNTGEDFDVETLGYAYSAKVGADGTFKLDKINPGDYLLTVYALSGAQAGVLYQQSVTIGTHPDTVNITVPSWHRRVLWQIGQANRRADEFKFSHEARNYKWKGLVPADLTYVIGKSQPASDWYYAQTQEGDWKVQFQLDHQQAAQLDIAFAAASNSGMTDPTTPDLLVSLNGKTLSTLTYSNDKAVYRSALQSGRYHLATISIPAADFVNGQNTLDLKLEGGMLMYDTIVLSAPGK